MSRPDEAISRVSDRKWYAVESQELEDDIFALLAYIAELEEDGRGLSLANRGLTEALAHYKQTHESPDPNHRQPLRTMATDPESE